MNISSMSLIVMICRWTGHGCTRIINAKSSWMA
uniref:Uncharacterized protein n=1 Tax=Arundo donax TaxID=35708 RepID=A0A0A8YWK5_ARUDO